MDFLATPARRKALFAALYLSEGAPIGFIWLALPTRLRLAGLPIAEITWLTAILVLPWTFKFAWAPLIDVLSTRRWTLRNWIIAAQTVMGATLIPLVWLDVVDDFSWIAGLLLAHALAAATQDVAIDALCISVTDARERGSLNGWMQAGMLIGRASMGGGALVIAAHIGHSAVVLLLVAVTTFSLLLVAMSRVPDTTEKSSDKFVGSRAVAVLWAIRAALVQRNTWIGLAFALVGGAAFKSLEVIIGPFLVDRGYEESEIGWFSAGPMIISMIAGSLAGGWLADRLERRWFVALSLVFIVTAIAGLAASDNFFHSERGAHLLILLATTAFGIGLFTAASYAMFMDITNPTIAATQFSAFMGATNGCESWSSFAVGRIVTARGYPSAMFAMCLASLAALPLLLLIRPSCKSPNPDTKIPEV